MSHWTKIKLQISDEETLVKALKRMGFEAQVGNFNVTQYGTTEKAEILIDQAVGFSRQADGTFAMVGDFYHGSSAVVKKFYNKNEKFQQELTTAYAVEDVKAKCDELGFTIEENAEAVIGADGMIRMVAVNYY